MKRLGGIWPEITAFSNLLMAYRRARLGKRSRPGVAEFELGLEGNLLRLQRGLISGEYRPDRYRQFTVYERKPRLITAASFRDRVLHHALIRVIEPAIDQRFIFDSYACRIGKGVHRAVDRYQEWSNQYRFALKLDIARYFPSIDRELMKEKLRRYIKDRNALALLDLIVDTAPEMPSVGVCFPGDDLLTTLDRPLAIPIGNLTSQFFANLYLDDFDHFVKERLGLKAYLRYVDDMVLLGNSKTWLHEVREVLAERLLEDRLLLHPTKAQVLPVASGVDLLGYLVFPDHRRLRNDNGHRFARRLRGFAAAFAAGQGTFADFEPSVQSWLGHARHADTEGLRRSIFAATVFRRGAGRDEVGAFCAAAPGTTNRTGCVRPTATGTTATTGTTTSGFVSPSPPVSGPELPRSRTRRE